MCLERHPALSAAPLRGRVCCEIRHPNVMMPGPYMTHHTHPLAVLDNHVQVGHRRNRPDGAGAVTLGRPDPAHQSVVSLRDLLDADFPRRKVRRGAPGRRARSAQGSSDAPGGVGPQERGCRPRS